MSDCSSNAAITIAARSHPFIILLITDERRACRAQTTGRYNSSFVFLTRWSRHCGFRVHIVSHRSRQIRAFSGLTFAVGSHQSVFQRKYFFSVNFRAIRQKFHHSYVVQKHILGLHIQLSVVTVTGVTLFITYLWRSVAY